MVIIQNALSKYYAEIQTALHHLHGEPAAQTDPSVFSPGQQLPPLTDAVRDYLGASDLSFHRLEPYNGTALSLLNLGRNPGTLTTKTFASLLLVARAVRFIQETHEPVTIVTPSSANKGIALRDAVLRAIRSGLVEPSQLNVVIGVPAVSASKLPSSELSDDPDLRRRNPVCVYRGPNPETVKALCRSTVADHRPFLERTTQAHLWYTLSLENYMAADLVRALAEADYFPATEERTSRTHAHAVSSAYGLLGHAYGQATLQPPAASPAKYLLVQHLSAPDLVVHLHAASGNVLGAVPAYAYDRSNQIFRQSETPFFPAETADPAEVLDSTFYTRNPPTAERMTAIIRNQGGSGIVVSRAECSARYGEIRQLLHATDVQLPDDPSSLREWSLVMAITGVLNAVDRGLVPPGEDIVIHNSGSYSSSDYTTIDDRAIQYIDSDTELARVIHDAA